MDANYRVAHVKAATEPLRAKLNLSGDKSVSIRRALFSLLSNEPVALTNYGTGEDCQTALMCLQALGKNIERRNDDVHISGDELRSNVTLDCRNSGTTARLMMGLLAGRNGEWTLIGDDSLSRRPMERVAAPLRAMGAKIELSERGCLPAHIVGQSLHGVDHDLQISSAQVKSALLLAGLSAIGTTRVREPLASRDHTERLLCLRQAPDGYWSVDQTTLSGHSIDLSGVVPGDISSAAFWAVAALLVTDSEIEIRNVLLNPLRAGWFECLRRAGADVYAEVESQICGEAVGRLRIRNSELAPLAVSADDVPGLIDEIPALAILASTVPGESKFFGVGELRVKECDRLLAITEGLNFMGVHTEVRGDDLFINGGKKLLGATINSRDDHRIAIAFALAGLVSDQTITIQGANCAVVSYPEFFSELSRLAPHSVTFSK